MSVTMEDNSQDEEASQPPTCQERPEEATQPPTTQEAIRSPTTQEATRPPTTQEDLARLLAIAGEESLPNEPAPPSEPAPPTGPYAPVLTAEPKSKAVSSVSLPARVATLPPDFNADGAIFRVQSFLAAVLVAIVTAALLTTSSLLLVPGVEVYRYEQPGALGESTTGKRGAGHRSYGTLVRIRPEELLDLRGESMIEDEPVQTPITVRAKQQARASIGRRTQPITSPHPNPPLPRPTFATHPRLTRLAPTSRWPHSHPSTRCEPGESKGAEPYCDGGRG